MTQSEFYRAQRAARRAYLDIFRQVNREISQLYIDAADEVSEKVRTMETNKKGDSITADSQRKLESVLRKTGARIAGETEEIITDSINAGITATSGPSRQYLEDAINISGISKIKYDVIDRMYAQLNEDFINLTYTRVWQDGYTFSNRIWGFPGSDVQPYLPGLSQYWENDVKNMLTFGFAQGRDIVQLAKDLSYYAVHGRKKLIQRYGKLVRGTKQFAKRFPGWIDWRAMRLARSELYISLQDAAKLQGRLNPAVLEYIWNLTAGAVHDCICPDLAADSPYQRDNIPDFPHPQCLCYITHRIRGRDDFVNDLIDWGKGLGVPYLDDWYVNYYLPFLSG